MMKQKIKFEIKGKKAIVYPNSDWGYSDNFLKQQNVLKIKWDNQEGFVKGVRKNKNVIDLKDIEYKGQNIDGMKVSKEIKNKIKELKEKTINKAKKEIKKEETEMKVVEKEYGRGYKTKVKVFDYDSKTLNEEEREKLREIEKILGKKQISGTGIDGINAKRFEEGKKFTVDELYEEIREEIVEKKLKKEQKEKEIKEKRKKAIKEAKEKGKEVKIRKINSYDGDTQRSEEEIGVVNVYEIATPNGEIKEKEIPTY